MYRSCCDRRCTGIGRKCNQVRKFSRGIPFCWHRSRQIPLCGYLSWILWQCSLRRPSLLTVRHATPDSAPASAPDPVTAGMISTSLETAMASELSRMLLGLRQSICDCIVRLFVAPWIRITSGGKPTGVQSLPAVWRAHRLFS
jgi:hypothetical protein